MLSVLTFIVFGYVWLCAVCYTEEPFRGNFPLIFVYLAIGSFDTARVLLWNNERCWFAALTTTQFIEMICSVAFADAQVAMR